MRAKQTNIPPIASAIFLAFVFCVSFNNLAFAESDAAPPPEPKQWEEPQEVDSRWEQEAEVDSRWEQEAEVDSRWEQEVEVDPSMQPPEPEQWEPQHPAHAIEIPSERVINKLTTSALDSVEVFSAQTNVDQAMNFTNTTNTLNVSTEINKAVNEAPAVVSGNETVSKASATQTEAIAKSQLAASTKLSFRKLAKDINIISADFNSAKILAKEGDRLITSDGVNFIVATSKDTKYKEKNAYITPKEASVAVKDEQGKIFFMKDDNKATIVESFSIGQK